MAIIRTTRYHVEITNIDKNGNLSIVYPKNTVDDVYMDPKKNVTIKGKVFFYGATAVDANVQTINVSVPGFQLLEGAHVTILFEHGITASNPKLKINNGIQTLAAVPIYYQNKPLPSDLIKERAVVDLVYSVGNFHVSHEFITPPLSLNNTRKFFLTGVDENNAKAYPDDTIYDNAVYVDSVEGRLCATSFLGTTVYFDTTASYINKTSYTGNSATTTKLKTARNITIGKKTNSFNGTANIEFTLAQIDAVAKDGDEMRGDLKITSGSSDDRHIIYRGNGINFILPTNDNGFAGGIKYVKPEDNSIEGMFGFYRKNYFFFGESYTNPNGTVKAQTFIGDLTGTADVAKKLGTTTVGSNTKFFYLNAGVATASTATIGSGIKPMFLSSGTFTASSSTVGSTTKPVYMNAGTITETDATVGSGVKPIYMSSGTITASSSTVGSGTKPVYMNAGTITASSSTVGSGVKPIYMSSGTITASSSTVGSTTKPVYMNAGTITECDSSLDVSITGTTAKANITNVTPDASTSYYPVFVTGSGESKVLDITSSFKLTQLKGTTSADGYDLLSLGNATASGTAGNKYGRFRLYNTNEFYTEYRSFPHTANANRYIVTASGTGGVGGTAKPVYIASTTGLATACSATVGSTTKPVYMNAGTITASDATVGGTAKPVYMNAGVISTLSATVGSTDEPVYLNAGTITKTGKTFSSYVPLSGGTMTGNLIMKNVYLNDGVNNRVVMQIFDDGDNQNYGSELVVGGAGNTFLGAGESATNLRNDMIAGNLPLGEGYSKAGEIMYISSDSDIYLMSNCNTIGSRNGLRFTAAGTFLPLTDNLTSLGTTSKRFKDIYLSGAASIAGRATATKLTLNTTGGSWISGMTLTNPSIQIATKNSSGSYHPVIGGKTYNDHIWNLGTYIDKVGFYGFYNGRTANASDWSFTFDVASGKVNSTGGITAPTFTGTASAVAGISGHIRDNLTGEGITDKALSANQGYQINQSLATKMPKSYFHWSGQAGQPTWLWGGNANNDYYVWNPANFRVANATTCGDLAPSHTTGANTIVTRQANGYTFLNYINSNTSYNENPAIGNFIVVNNSDGNYYRKASVAHVKSALGVPTFSLSGTTLTITL